ncbi:MAG: hypothetical protein HY016_01375 [Nitrosomonadales bacterium]|nr:hypothetical protein [Nitrosomonadales bacterium]
MNPLSCKQYFPAWLLGFFGAAFAVAAYLQALRYPFVFDDIDYISTNTKLSELRLTELWRLFAEPYNGMSEFLPLRELSYWFDMTLFGLNPSELRIHNILLYLFCLPLVYAVTLSIWRYFRAADAASAPWAAAAVTALFALHPSHAEAVVWIAARKDILSTLLSLLAIWLAIHAKREQGLSSRYAIAALFALLAAMLSKATAIAIAPVMAIIWLGYWRDIPVINRRRTMLLWPLSSLMLAVCVAIVFATIITSKIPMYFGIEAVVRTLAVLGWLARLSVSPESRHFFYPVFEDPNLPLMVGIGVTVLSAAVAGAVVLLRKRSLEGFAVVVYFLLCLPSLQLVPYAVPSLVSDRFIVLATWPAVLLLVALAWRVSVMPRAALLLVIALSWGYQTVQRPRDWQSFEVLVEADLSASPGFYFPAIYKIFGFQLREFKFNEALQTAQTISIPEFRSGVIAMIDADYVLRVETIKTGNPGPAMEKLWNLGLALHQKPVEAKWNSPINNFWDMRRDLLEMEWQFLIERFPDDISVRYRAGLWMLDAGKFAQARIHLLAAAESPNLEGALRGVAYKNLGMALLGSGDIIAAEAMLRKALTYQQADQQVYCLLSWVYSKTKRYDEAARVQAGCSK